MNAHSYNVVIRFIDDQDCYEARILELPDIAEYADTYQEAYDLAMDAIETTAEIMELKGRAMPAPQIPAESDYSGRITLRLPKSLHAAMVKISEQEDASLNQMICNILSAYRGFDGAMQKTMEGWSKTPTGASVRASATKRQTLRLVRSGTPTAHTPPPGGSDNDWGRTAAGG